MGFEPQSFELGFAVVSAGMAEARSGSPSQAAKSFYASEIDLEPVLPATGSSPAGASAPAEA